MKSLIITLQLILFQLPVFSQEQVLVPYRTGNLWGLADENKKIVVAPQFEETRFLSEGLAAAKKNGKWGYIDEIGRIKIKFVYELATEFIDGKALVRLNDQAVGCYINKSGEITGWVKGIPDDLNSDKEYLENYIHSLENILKRNYDTIIPIENGYIAKKHKKELLSPSPTLSFSEDSVLLTSINSFASEYNEIKVFKSCHQYIFARKADSTVIYDLLSKDYLTTSIPYENITNACSSFFMYKENSKIGLKSIKNGIIEDLLLPLYSSISIPVINTSTNPYPFIISSIFLLEGLNNSKGIYVYDEYTIAPKYPDIDPQPVTTSKHLYFYVHTKEGRGGYINESGVEFFEEI